MMRKEYVNSLENRVRNPGKPRTSYPVLKSSYLLLCVFFTIRLNNLIVRVFLCQILYLHEENLSSR